MQINDIGIATDGPANSGLLRQLETELAYYFDVGFRLVEVNPLSFGLIVHGELRQKQLANYVAVLKNFDFRYSVHGLDRLNLAYDPRHELCRRIMTSQIEICRAVGASRLVYHSGLQSLETVYYGLRQSLLTVEELTAGVNPLANCSCNSCLAAFLLCFRFCLIISRLARRLGLLISLPSQPVFENKAAHDSFLPTVLKKSSWRWSDSAFRLAQDPDRWSCQHIANWPPGNNCLDNAAGRQMSPLIPENNPNALASALLSDG